MEQQLLINNNIPKSYFRLTIPTVLGMVVTMIYNLADTYFIAATDNTLLVAGVALCAPILTIQMALGNVFAQGGCTLTARLLGAGKGEDIKRVSSFCIYVGYLSGILIGLFFLLARGWMIPALGSDAETFVYALPYYNWIIFGSPFIVASYVYTNLFRSEGLAKEAMIGSSIGAILNIIIDPLFIITLGLGAKGAAIATVIGYVVSDIYCTVVLLKKSKIFSLNLGMVRVSREHLKQIFGIGIPAAIMNIVQSLSLIFINQSLLPYGNGKIAAMGIAQRSLSIVFFVLIGMAYGGQPLFGYFFGAKDTKNLKKLAKFNIMVSALVAAILSILVFVGAPWLIRCFMDQPQIVHDGSVMLRIQVSTMIFAGVVLLLTLVFQSAGKIGMSFLLSISRQGYIFLSVLFILSHIWGYYGVIAAQAVADVVSFILVGFLFYRFIYKTWQ